MKKQHLPSGIQEDSVEVPSSQADVRGAAGEAEQALRRQDQEAPPPPGPRGS